RVSRPRLASFASRPFPPDRGIASMVNRAQTTTAAPEFHLFCAGTTFTAAHVQSRAWHRNCCPPLQSLLESGHSRMPRREARGRGFTNPVHAFRGRNMLWTDLRDYIAALDKLGELRVVRGASWEEDIGGI